MKIPIVGGLLILSLVACHRAGQEGWTPAANHALLFSELGETPPSSCRRTGTVFIGAQTVFPADRITGSHLETFFLELGRQARALGANLVVPTGAHSVVEASEHGLQFEGTAYACSDPEDGKVSDEL